MKNKLTKTVKYIFSIAGVCAAVASTILLFLSYSNDKPKLRVKVTAKPPLFRFYPNKEWSTTAYKNTIDEYYDIEITKLISRYLIETKLIDKTAIENLIKKQSLLLNKFTHLQTSIPITMFFANNGKRSTTIIACKITTYGYFDNKPRNLNLQEVKEYIEPGNIVKLDKHINFHRIPDAILKNIILNTLSEKFNAVTGNNDFFSKMKKSDFFNDTLFQSNDISWKDMPFVLEITIEDQHGNIATDKTVIMEDAWYN